MNLTEFKPGQQIACANRDDVELIRRFHQDVRRVEEARTENLLSLLRNPGPYMTGGLRNCLTPAIETDYEI